MNYKKKFLITLFGLVSLVLVFLIISIIKSSKSKIEILAEDVPTVRAIKAQVEELWRSGKLKTEIHFDLHNYEEMNRLANLDLGSSAGVYDIILQYNTALANYVRKNYILPYSEILKAASSNSNANIQLEANIFENCWKEVGWYFSDDNKKISPFGLPFSANTMFLAYNKILFKNYAENYYSKYGKKLEPPTNWEEMLQIAQYFDKQNGLHGIALQGASYFIYYEWANMAFSFGGGVMEKKYGWEGNDTTKLLLTSPKTIEATKYYLNLLKYNGSNDFYSTDALTQTNILKKGKTAMGVVWSDVAYNLVAKDGGYDSTFAFVPIPGPISMLAGGSFYINKKSKHYGESAELIVQLLQEENQIKMMRNGLCSPLKSVYSNKDILAIPYTNALGVSLNRGVYMLEAGYDADVIVSLISDALQAICKANDPSGIESVLKKCESDIMDKRKEIFNYLKSEK